MNADFSTRSGSARNASNSSTIEPSPAAYEALRSADAPGLASAAELGVPTAAWHKGSGMSFEQMLTATLAAQQPDVIALAGFMRILSGAFVGHWLGRIFNVHPSLLPDYRGLNTHRRVLAAGDAAHGASVHFVAAELDGAGGSAPSPAARSAQAGIRPAPG